MRDVVKVTSPKTKKARVLSPTLRIPSRTVLNEALETKGH